MRHGPGIVALAILAAACDGGADALSAPAARALALAWNGASPGAARVLASIALPTEAGPWSTEADRTEWARGGGEPCVQLAGAGDVRVWVPAEAWPAEAWPTGANLVVVDAAASEPLRLRLGVARAGTDGESSVRWSEEVVALGRDERRHAEFTIDPEPQDSHIVLHAHAKNRVRLSVFALELRDSPVVRRVAPCDEPARWIALAEEVRPAFALAPEHGLAAELDVPPRAKLAFGYGFPAGVAADARLAVRITSLNGAAAGEERALAEFVRSNDAWNDARADLAPWAGTRVRLAFAVEGAPYALVAGAHVFEPQERSPTVLLITSDTHRADHLGCTAPGGGVTTPALDRLAAEGVLFERAFASSNITLPSHVTLMTGINPRDSGVIDNVTRLDERALTLAEPFRAAGWATMAVVSARHLAPGPSGLGQGFERFSVPTEVERTAQDSVRCLRSWLASSDGRPLFAWLHLFDAHRPYEASEENARAAYGPSDPFDRRRPRASFPSLPEGRGARDPGWIQALYRAQIHELDRELAHLFGEPRIAAGIIAFTADHGENLGEVGLWWDHMGAFPAVLRVPLVLRWPGAPRGARVPHTVAQADVARTLLDLAGVDAREFPGTNLRAWLGEQPQERTLFAVASSAHGFAATRGRWHLSITLHNGAKPEFVTQDNAGEHPVQLFDLEHDPLCEQNLAARERARVAELGRALITWLEGERRTLAASGAADAETLATIAELGYAEETPEAEDPGAETRGDAPGSRTDAPVSAGIDRLDPARVRSVLEPYLAQ